MPSHTAEKRRKIAKEIMDKQKLAKQKGGKK